MICAVTFVVASSLYATENEAALRVESTALLVRTPSAATGAAAGAAPSEWQALSALREATGNNTYVTSAATAPTFMGAASGGGAPQQILVSTTFHGIYETIDGGATWTDLGEVGEIDPLYLGEGFYEDIAAVAYDEQPGVIWVELAQTGEIIAIDRRRSARIDLTEARGRRALEKTVRAAPVVQPPIDEATQRRHELAADHTSFYLSPWQLSEERLAEHMAFADEHGFSAVVIDFKDDHGRLIYDSQLEPHRSLGAVRSFVEARRIIDTVHEHGLYLIARVVVFKDEQLYNYRDNAYALWDRRRDAPWGVFRNIEDEETGQTVTTQVEYWVDPFSEFVWDYNIAVAEELVELGVDEIQFDYIRTPADGRTRDIVYRHRTGSPALADDDPYRDDRVEALSTFLRRAREKIDIPIGIDVFGFNGWYRMSYLGQDISLLARYVDVVSPMLYPSHFPRDFLGEYPYLEWAEVIYREGVARGRRLTGGHALIRPYIQAFLIGGELQFELPTYTEYLKRQIRGSLDAEASGFTLWNNSGRYYMLARGLWFPDGPRIVRAR